jgi:hypothetical protein
MLGLPSTLWRRAHLNTRTARVVRRAGVDHGPVKPVTTLTGTNRAVVPFYNGRRTAER